MLALQETSKKKKKHDGSLPVVKNRLPVRCLRAQRLSPAITLWDLLLAICIMFRITPHFMIICQGQDVDLPVNQKLGLLAQLLFWHSSPVQCCITADIATVCRSISHSISHYSSKRRQTIRWLGIVILNKENDGTKQTV